MQNLNAMAPLSFKTPVGYASLLIWVIMLQSYFLFSAACLNDERGYLLDFKSGLNLSSGRLSSWRGSNCCEWEGVACDYHTSHVITLDLGNDYDDYDYDYDDYYDYDYWYNHRLSGELRPSLFNLQHLQHLDLSGNSFKGISIPPQLSKLQRLTFLKLSRAEFCGEVPLEFGNMSNLRHLDVSNNYWVFKTSDNHWQSNELNSSKFDVWVRNLRSLEFLAMDLVNLSKSSEHWGEALNSLPNLTQIHLYDCGLSSQSYPFIPDLSNLTRLSHLHIGENSFPFELPTWLENVSSLVSLDLSGCALDGFIPSNFMPRSRLSSLELSLNPDLKGDLAFILIHSVSLVVLSLGSCNLTGVFPPFVANFSKLKTLHLVYNNLEGSIPSSLGSFSSLQYLDLSHNNLSGRIPPSLCQLSALSSLHLGHNQLSGTIPQCISKMGSLKVLSLPSNGLSGNISLQLLTSLEVLELSQNQFHISIFTNWVPRFVNLDLLGLGSCNIEGNIPAFLSQQYQLGWLDLSDNNIVGNIPTWLWDLPSLSMLNVSNNNLEGSLPLEDISDNLCSRLAWK